MAVAEQKKAPFANIALVVSRGPATSQEYRRYCDEFVQFLEQYTARVYIPGPFLDSGNYPLVFLIHPLNQEAQKHATAFRRKSIAPKVVEITVGDASAPEYAKQCMKCLKPDWDF